MGPQGKGRRESTGLWERMGLRGGTHTTVTPWQRDRATEQGPHHGEGIVPQGRDHAGDTGPHGGDGTPQGPVPQQRLTCGMRRKPPAGLRFISAQADPNNYTDTESALARLCPAMTMKTHRRSPGGCRGSAWGTPGRWRGAGRGNWVPRFPTALGLSGSVTAARGHGSKISALKRRQLLRRQPEAARGHRPVPRGRRGVPRQGFKGPRDLK